MRPYSGIGVLVIDTVPPQPIPLYEEPGIIRSGVLNSAAAHELTAWIAGTRHPLVLLVTARKSEWLKIERDDAGREAWLKPERRWQLISWEQFFKGRQVAFLRNAPKKQMQLLARAGDEQGTPFATKRSMKVITLQSDWAYVVLDQSSGGWIRWRDRDGRLLVGVDETHPTQSR